MIAAMIYSPTAAHASTTSIVIPMTTRFANPTETAGMETVAGQTIYPQFGSNINGSYSETSKDVHTGRSWVVEAKPNLQACDTNVTFSIEGNHTFTHVGNNGPLVKAGDEPEVGGLIVDGGDTTLLKEEAVAPDVDMAIGKTLPVIASPTEISVALANTGIKVIMYVETRDDRDQKGVQASFTYTGTAQLRITYDHSGCNIPTTTAASTTKNKAPAKKSAATTPTTIPTAVQGEVIENNAYVMGKKVSVSNNDALTISSRKNISVPHVKKSSSNALVNAVTFGTMVVLLGIGLFIFIVKQKGVQRSRGYRSGRT